MNRYIALLRGINVGGHKKILMAHLRVLFESLGFKEVKTYIQSGNIVFMASEGTNLSVKISEEIKKKYGWKVPVLVKTAAEIESILANCPFSEEKKEKSYFILLDSEPKNVAETLAQQISYPKEEFFITANCVYIFYALGAGKAKLGNNWFEKKLEVTATSRNYRTLKKLIELSN